MKSNSARQQKPLAPPTTPTFEDALDEAAESIGAAIGHLDDAKQQAIRTGSRNPAGRIMGMQAILKLLARQLVNLHPTEKTP